MNGDGLGMYAKGTTCRIQCGVIDIEPMVSAVSNKRHVVRTLRRHDEGEPRIQLREKNEETLHSTDSNYSKRNACFSPHFFSSKTRDKEGMLEKEKTAKS